MEGNNNGNENVGQGEIQEKAIALPIVRVGDVSNVLRIECVEKLELLNKPEERQRRIHEIPEVHAGPPMDATYESDEET
ncbi:hypothetical protein Dimus_021226 [Dionaea muscipula]